MRILKLRATRGPNFYSVTRPKLIVLRLDLQELCDVVAEHRQRW